MKVLNIFKFNQRAVINEAVNVLKKGGVIVYPTETAYGLGADFFNPKAIEKVYQIKGRNFKKQLPILVSTLAMAKKLVKFDAVSLKLAKRYWPGALTLVQKSKVKSQNYSSKFKTLGLRISSNKLASAIVKKFGGPITATSANVAGKSECYSISEVINQFKNKKYQPDLVIDGGMLLKRKVSTVVQVIDGRVKVLRKGTIDI